LDGLRCSKGGRGPTRYRDIVVTVYDMNANPKRILLQNERINGFASPKCGHDDTRGFGNDSAVDVHADSSCSA
jgi:hypothetical protein